MIKPKRESGCSGRDLVFAIRIYGQSRGGRGSVFGSCTDARCKESEMAPMVMMGRKRGSGGGTAEWFVDGRVRG